MNSSYEYDTTMECRENGVLCGVVRNGGRGYYYDYYYFNFLLFSFCFFH